VNTVQVVDYFFEATEDEDSGIKVFADRLMLRIFSYPSLLAHLKNINIVDETVELDFIQFPDQILPEVVRLFGPVRDVKTVKFEDKGQKHVGFKITVE